jgi:dCTP deaminase
VFLSDETIRRYVERGKIEIDPFDLSLIQPCSYDLTLADETYAPFERSPILSRGRWSRGGLLRPGYMLLGSTRERVKLPADIAGTLSGKSSLGRSGLLVHVTAGHIDPGFEGTITLELVNISPEPLPLSEGMPIAQLLLTMLDLPATHPYHGRYQNQLGPTPTRL